ncbi:hypothetical protein FRC07_004367 [Ceratobasidium sp. 392]|nr:hypothetical protein FRC07_004367 [Ceratobasidium sp. 392]
MFPALLDRKRHRRPPPAGPPNKTPSKPEPRGQDEDLKNWREYSPPTSLNDPSKPVGTEARPPKFELATEESKPMLPSASSNTRPMTAEDIKFLSQEAELLTDYVREAKDFDEDMVDGWNRSLDVTLVFASLFSAIVTAFVLESAKQLEPDKADQTVEILREIARTLQAGAVRPQVTGNYEASADTEFHPTRSAVWVNCFWFLSLSTSMSVSLAAILAKQWCYYYLSGRSGDAVNQAEERLKRYRGLDKWMMREILEHLPLLMHIALSILDPSCPFKTTQSVYMRVFVDRVSQWFHTIQPAMLRKTESIRNEPRHTAIDVQSTDSLSHAAGPPSPVGSNQEAIRPFVKEALEWLIFNSQNSASIDTAIGALVVGRVQFDNGDLERQAMFHMARHFSDCFSPGPQGFKLQLKNRQNALKQALDYVGWMTYFAGNKPAGVTEQVRQFVSTLGSELVTRLGLAFASLADQRTLSVDVGKNVAFWLSSFIKCYDKETIYLTEDILSIIIDGLTIAGRNVGEIQDRAHVLAIPQLISILWKVSHVDKSGLRSSIALNLAVFALITNIPYSINKRNFKSTADHLAYNYRSPVDRNASFTSFVVFALLGFVHPKSKLHFDVKTLDISTQIIYKTNYLAPATLTVDLPGIVEYYPLRHSSPSRSINLIEETTPMAEDSAERTASATLALIMERSDNKQCLETAVRTMLFHTNRCNVELVMQATRWFSHTFGAPEFSEENINENQLLHICGYARILASMALHCTDPDGLARSLHIGDETSVDAAEYTFVRNKLQLIATRAQDRHVHAFATAAIAAWKFACPNKTYRSEVTQDTLQNVWDLIIKHADHSRGAEPSERATGQQVHEDILRPEAIEALVDTTVLFTAVTDSMVKLNSLQARALLRLADQFRPDTKQPVRLASVRIALSIALAFWGLSLDLTAWEFWTLDDRKKWWRVYLHPKKRESDVAALFLLGISRILAHYEQLMLNHASIKTISLEIDRYMQQHADHPDTLTLPFLTGFDVRRHVRESVRDYLQGTESDGPFTHSTTMSRDRLRSALQYDGGEGFRYEVPHPLSPRVSERQVSFSENPAYDTQAAQAPEAP